MSFTESVIWNPLGLTVVGDNRAAVVFILSRVADDGNKSAA